MNKLQKVPKKVLIHPQVPLLKKYFEVKDDKNIAIQLTTAGEEKKVITKK